MFFSNKKLIKMSEEFNLDERINNPTVVSVHVDSDNLEIKEDEISQEIIENKPVKISEVPKESQIILNDKIFQFFCTIKNEKISLKLCEIGSFAPFIYIKNITLEGFKEIHSMFRSCDNLETVKKHIDKLFADGKIELTQQKDDSINFVITARNISEKVTIEIPGDRIITNEKDEALMTLYKIQKDQIKLLKDISNYIKTKEKNGSEIISKIKEIINHN